jgi:hypothetical protein
MLTGPLPRDYRPIAKRAYGADMTIELIINAVLSLAVLGAVFGVFGLAWTALRDADMPAARREVETEQQLPYAA